MKLLAVLTFVPLALLFNHPSPAVCQQTRPARGTTAPAWGAGMELVEEVRIGVLDGEPEYVFGWIVDTALGPDGSIFVVDGQGPIVRRYSAEGAYLDDIGRTGEGPGEFKGHPEIEITPDGRLVMLDAANRRVTYLDLDGTHLLDWPLPADLLMASDLTVDMAGNLWLKTATVDRERPEWDWPRSIVKFSPEGEELASIPVPSEGPGGGSWVLAGPEGFMWPFVARVTSDMSPAGYLVTGSTADYSFDLVHPDGSRQRIERDWEPLELNREERSQWESWGRFFVKRRQPGGPEVVTDIPKVKPAYREIDVDEEGRIWVDRYVEAVHRDRPPRDPGDDRPLLTWFEPRTFDVFGRDGEFLGTVVLPPNTSIRNRKGMHVLGEQTGEFDETYIVLFRLESN